MRGDLLPDIVQVLFVPRFDQAEDRLQRVGIFCMIA